MVSNVKSGKEATVYKVLLDDKLVAMKVYKNQKRDPLKYGTILNGKILQETI